MEYVASFDFGTSGVKAALVSREGNLVAICEKGYPLLRPEPLWVEQRPEDFWNAVCEVTHGVLQTSGVAKEDVKGINFSVQSFTLIPVDEDGNVLYNAISWLDGRAESQANEINEYAGEILVRPQDKQSRILWIKECMPELYEKTKFFLDCDGFLQYKCTGIMAVAEDYDGILWRHPTIKAYEDAASALLDREKLPPMVEACRKYGGLNAQGAADLGLVEGTPVFGGMIDVPAAAAGCCCIRPGDAHVYFGSSGWISVMIDEAYACSEGTYQLNSIMPGLMIYGGCTNCCCTMQNWIIDRFYSQEKESMGEELFKYLAKELEKVPDGCDGLYATPWLFGEQFPIADPHLRALFFNVKDVHTRNHFLKAVLESLCYSMRGQLDICKKDTGITVSKIGANGGGSLSPVWMQMLADILGVPVEVPENSRHSGAIGAALAAAIGLGWCTVENVNDFVHIKCVYHPDPAKKSMYDQKYTVWYKLYDAVKDLYGEINAEAE